MALDPYSPCPAGTGKKLKFCCSDLGNELEKIQRMIEGDQRLACVDYIEKLEGRYPGRACLLTYRAMLLLELNRADEAKQTIQRVLADAAGNPVALAELALVTLGERDVPKAIETLQLAIAASPSQMPVTIVDAIASIAESLAALGEFRAALGHLLLVANLLPEDERTLALIVRLNASPQVPLLFKEEPDFLPAPEGVAWKARFDEANEPSRRGAWRASADKLALLAEAVPDSPAIWRNLAQLRSWLLDDRGAVEALRKLASLDIPLDDRVEAEALAQLLDAEAPSEQIDLLQIEYPIGNIEELTENLSDSRVSMAPIDPSAWTERNEAPPRNSYILLDRPAPRTGVGISRDAVPNVLAHLMVFGRQTDRDARLEMSVARPHLAAAQTALDGLCGSKLGPAGDQEKRGDLPISQWALSWNWRLPEDTPVDEVHKLLVDQRRYSILQTWATTPLTVLEGKTPQQAGPDERLRIRLLAAILLLELSFQEPSVGDVFDELRRRLELPPARTIDPAETNVSHIPLARMHRVDWQKADDEALLAANRRAMFSAARLALRKTALAILQRESLQAKVDRAQVYGLLARMEDDTSQAIRYLDQARTAAEATGKSNAMWDIQELAMRLDRGEPEEFSRLLAHIQTHHAREPGVAQALMQILVEAGLVTPDGRPVRPPEESATFVVPGAGAEPGKIWTPESEAGAGKKSALWVPGSE